MGLVGRLAGDPRAARNPFTDEAAARFAASASHPAVKLMAAMRASGFTLDTAAQYAVYLSSPPALAPIHPAPEFFALAAGGPERLDAWRVALSSFARDSGFAAWEAETRPRREEMAAAVRAAQGGRDLGAPLAELLGARTWSDWLVAVSAFYPNGGGASWVLEEKPGRPDVFIAYGLYWKDGAYDGGGARRFAFGALPEAAFTMAYAAYESCRPVLASGGRPCAGFKSMSEGEDCYERHWVAAIVARVLSREYGADAAREFRSQHETTRFDKPVAKALDAYAADRARWPDMLAATALLAAPLRDDGKPPECRLIDPRRFGEEVYARRLAYYLDARLEKRPDAELEKTRADLDYMRGAKK